MSLNRMALAAKRLQIVRVQLGSTVTAGQNVVDDLPELAALDAHRVLTEKPIPQPLPPLA